MKVKFVERSSKNVPNFQVEWYYNGKKLPHGHRYRTFHDFGIVILDILYCYEENSGVYECRATNQCGSDVTKANLKCMSKANLILDSQLPRVSRHIFVAIGLGICLLTLYKLLKVKSRACGSV